MNLKLPVNHFAIRREQGFEIYVLRNKHTELAVVPELGARIISLKDLRTGREWLWHPRGTLKLFRNRVGEDFSQSPLAGMDECFPTIAPCRWRGRKLPDHGEVWSAPWTVDIPAFERGILQTGIKLRVSPFELARKIELWENEIQISYRLSNGGTTDEHFLWTLHPLLRLQTGDQLELPASTRALLNGETWVDAIDSAIPGKNCAKVFAMPVCEGWAAVHNRETGDRLEFAWNPAENNALGLWLTRGGWHGHHHFAIEPTNGDADALAFAAERKRCGMVAAAGTVHWQICLRIGL